MSKIDYKDLAEYYAVHIEAWHLFYESFKDYDNALLVGKGVLVEMNSEVIKAKKSNPNNERIKATEKRIEILFNVIDKMTGLNSRCNNLQIKIKQSVAKQMEIEKENEKLRFEIEALTKSLD